MFKKHFRHTRLIWLLLICCLLYTQNASAQVPAAQFTANNVSGCAPLTVTFQDQSTGSPTSWNWDLGNGSLPTTQNPTVTYSTPGTYTITLVVRNANGTNGITKTNYITVFPSPTADFAANVTIGCLPIDIQFTDYSVAQAGNITSWYWTFGDGTTSTQQNPQKSYSASGFYSVSLQVTSSTGCKGTKAIGNYIRIVPGVKAEFSNTTPITCRPPFQTTFNNLTSGPGTMTYQWDFGNSTGSSQTNPQATYATPGNYNVSLIAQSQYGCADTIQKSVTINGSGTAFTSPDTVCLNSTVNFQNTSSPAPLSAAWDFGNGRTSKKLSDTSTYNTAGDYTVKLVNTFTSCVDSAIKVVTVLPQPTVNFSANNQLSCKAPFTVNFQDLSPDAAQWSWDFGDGTPASAQQNPAHTYTSPGSYHVTLTITTRNGCINKLTQNNFIQIVRPDIKISNLPAGGCVPFAFAPVPNVTTIDAVTSWFWDYGHNGATSTQQNPPAHNYTDSGTYTVKLVITTSTGCTDSLVVTNAVKTGPPPVANFSFAATDTCALSQVAFTDLSHPADQWSWDFGDGKFSSLQNPTHSYADTGTFQVTLTAYNNGCPRVFTHPQSIHIKPPVADFSDTVFCGNKLQVVFTNESIVNPAYGPVSYLWKFGDPANSTSTRADTSFTYPRVGSYQVSLQVTNGSCSQTFTKTIKLVGDVADFTVSDANICRDESVTFTAINSDPANIILYEWSLDGGSTWTPGPRAYTLPIANPGIYNVALRITDINNCQNVKTVASALTVTGPIAFFSVAGNGGCRNKPVTFNDLSSPANGITKWIFEYGDNQTQTFTSAVPFTHVYKDTGLVNIKLTVQDNTGCSSSYSIDRYPITGPVPGFAASSTICPQTVMTFTDTTVGKGLHYAWNFGDGNTSTLQHPTHSFGASDSSYHVQLIVTDTSGCIDSVTHTILVRRPKPAFSIRDTTTICPPIETIFTFQGRDYESFYWDFGDGSTSTLQNPSHFYNTYGAYTAKLHLIGYGGCIESDSAVVHLYDPYSTSNLTYSPITACNQLLVDFNLTTPPSTTFLFYYDDGKYDSSQAHVFQHLYEAPGYYNPSFTLSDKLGCQVHIGGTNQIDVIGSIPFFGLDKKAFCDSGTVVFTSYPVGNDPVVTRVWDFGDGATDNVLHPVHKYQTAGTFIVSQSVTTQTGCSKTITDTIRVFGTPHAQIQGDTIACINELLPLHGALNVPDTAVAFSWTFGNGINSDVQSPSVRYTAAGNYTVKLETANKLNCKSTTSRGIFVPPNPVITIANDPVMPVGSSIPIPASYSDNIATYTWTPATNLSCADCPIPLANPKSTTKYNIKVQDIYGCESNRDVTVVVVCNDYNYFMPNTFSPNGDGVNDIFAPRGRGLARVGSLRIFNRWGELVFEKKDFVANDRTPAGGWDGTYKGKPAIADTYVYIVEFICENSAVIPFKGNVTLIR